MAAATALRGLSLFFAPVTEFSARVGKDERRCASMLCAACCACAASALLAAVLLVVGSYWLQMLVSDASEAPENIVVGVESAIDSATSGISRWYQREQRLG